MGRGQQTVVKDLFSRVFGERRGHSAHDREKTLVPTVGSIREGILGFIKETTYERPLNRHGAIVGFKATLEETIQGQHPDWDSKDISEAIKSLIRDGTLVADRIGMLYYQRTES